MSRIGQLKRNGASWDSGGPLRPRKMKPVILPGGRQAAKSGRGADPARVWDGTREPALADVFADPVVWKVMDRDGLTLQDLAAVVRNTRERLATRDA